MTWRIFDLDGSVARQARLIERLGGGLDIVDLRSLGPAVRYLPSNRSAAALDAAVTAREPARLTFTGSGDFHHVSASILKRVEEPVSVIVFDQHSDWIGSSPCPCGSWLLEALKLKQVARIVAIGVDRKSIEGWKLCHGPVAHLLSGRIELYPHDCLRSRCLGRRYGEPACATVKRRLISTDLYWNTVAGNDWGSLINDIIDRLPTDSVYVSIDKDCLAADCAVTNWGNGHLTLDQLVEAIAMLTDRKQIVGADITGEYSPVQVENRLVHAMAVKIHPKMPEPTADGLKRNEDTNLVLMEAMGFLSEARSTP